MSTIPPPPALPATTASFLPLEAVLHGQREVLARLTAGEPLRTVLDSIARYAELCSPDMLGSILVYEPASGRLRPGGYGRLPKSFEEAIDGLAPGPSAGSCGTAAYRGARVVSEDVHTDPLWEAFRPFAAQYGIRAAWSSPLRSPLDGALLGVFGMYYPRPGAPTAGDLAFVDHFTHLATLAIDAHRREAALHASEDARHAGLRALVAGLAHELNTPLGVARTAADLLHEAGGASPPLSLLQANIERAIGLVRSFRSAILSQRAEPAAPLAVAEAVTRVVFTSGPALEARKLQVVVEADDPSVSVPTVAVGFGEVITNLLLNAAVHAYGGEGGEVRVRIGVQPQAPEHLAVVVQDHGRGMAATEAARCQEPFFTTARKNGSSGLGLFLARHITESELGGRLLLETAPGAGTRWTLLLPLRGPARRPADPAAP